MVGSSNGESVGAGSGGFSTGDVNSLLFDVKDLDGDTSYVNSVSLLETPGFITGPTTVDSGFTNAFEIVFGNNIDVGKFEYNFNNGAWEFINSGNLTTSVTLDFQITLTDLLSNGVPI